MLNLLVVDDEKYLVQSLVATYDWESMGISSVHTAYCAKDALNILSTAVIHIMITDIRMPGNSGLELIEKARECSPATKCILLSGYSEFEYAKKAVKLHAEGYLLKPVKEAELTELVTRTVENIEREQRESQEKQQLLYVLDKYLPVMRDDFLMNLLQGESFLPREFSKRLESLGLDVRENTPFVMMIIRIEQGFENYDDSDKSLVEYAVRNIGEEIFGAEFSVWSCRNVDKSLPFLIMPRDGSVRSGITEKLERCALLLQESVTHFLKGEISILLSDWGTFPDDVYDFYRGLIAVFRAHPEKLDIFYMRDLKSEAAGKNAPLKSFWMFPMMWRLLEAGRWDAAEGKLRELTSEIDGLSGAKTDHLYQAAMILSFSFSWMLHIQGRPVREQFGKNLPEISGHEAVQSVQGLLKWGLRMIQMLKQNSEREAKSGSTFIIQQINRYVQTNFQNDISLQSIADHVFLHPAYVSKIYKSETGEGLSEYISRLRMEKAICLLRETNDKIGDISKKIGYQNPSHFSKLFRQYYDMTPEKYRESNPS